MTCYVSHDNGQVTCCTLIHSGTNNVRMHLTREVHSMVYTLAAFTRELAGMVCGTKCAFIIVYCIYDRILPVNI